MTVLVKDVKEGDVLITDDGFTCIGETVEVTVMKNDDGELYFLCSADEPGETTHLLESQISSDEGYGAYYIGLRKRSL